MEGLPDNGHITDIQEDGRTLPGQVDRRGISRSQAAAEPWQMPVKQLRRTGGGNDHQHDCLPAIDTALPLRQL